MDRVRFPEPLRCLFQPNRYKILYGGRGGAKSWGVARALIIIGAERPIRILCAREFQSSISDSVHKLLSDQIELMGYGDFYTIEKASIKGLNGTEFSFAGIKHNVGRIKSYEGVDIVWVEEAQNVSKNSWETLIPTIRKDGSEIWVTLNPELDTDETWADATSIWFAQAVGLEYRVIDFLQMTQTAIPNIIQELQKRGYVYGIDYLPHDAQARSLSGAGRSIEQMMRGLGRTVHVQPRSSISDGINAVRSVFPNCWFDADKCADGLQALRHYRYKVDPESGQFSKEPLHDENSHAADAFRGLAMSLVAKTPKRPKVYERPNYGAAATGWMG
jgi:hypothetical protein